MFEKLKRGRQRQLRLEPSLAEKQKNNDPNTKPLIVSLSPNLIDKAKLKAYCML